MAGGIDGGNACADHRNAVRSAQMGAQNGVLLDKTNVFEANPFTVRSSKRARQGSSSELLIRGKLLSEIATLQPKAVVAPRAKESCDGLILPQLSDAAPSANGTARVDEARGAKRVLIRENGKYVVKRKAETPVRMSRTASAVAVSAADVTEMAALEHRTHTVEHRAQSCRVTQSNRTTMNEQIRARHAEWQRQYRRAFPSFRFYFDNVEENTKRKVIKHLNSLGAHAEPFFCAAVTHVVTTREIPDFASGEYNIDAGLPFDTIIQEDQLAQGPHTRSRHPSHDDKLLKNDILFKAWSMKMKIWSLESK